MVSVDDKVDIFTLDEELWDRIDMEYPSATFLTADQMGVDNSDGKTIYRYTKLDKAKVMELAEIYKGKYEFEIRDSETGAFLMISHKADPNMN